MLKNLSKIFKLCFGDNSLVKSFSSAFSPKNYQKEIAENTKKIADVTKKIKESL